MIINRGGRGWRGGKIFRDALEHTHIVRISAWLALDWRRISYASPARPPNTTPLPFATTSNPAPVVSPAVNREPRSRHPPETRVSPPPLSFTLPTTIHSIEFARPSQNSTELVHAYPSPPFFFFSNSSSSSSSSFHYNATTIAFRQSTRLLLSVYISSIPSC